MYLLRFMSQRELSLYLRGQEILGQSEQANQNVCFFRDNVLTSMGVLPHYIMSDSLSGIVSEDVLARFYIDDKSFYELQKKGEFHSAYETYADPYGGWLDTITVLEERVKKYDSDLLKLDSICFKPDFSYSELVDAKNLNSENLNEYINYSEDLKKHSDNSNYCYISDDRLSLDINSTSMKVSITAYDYVPTVEEKKKLLSEFNNFDIIFHEDKTIFKSNFYKCIADLPERFMGGKGYESLVNSVVAKDNIDSIEKIINTVYEETGSVKPYQIDSFLNTLCKNVKDETFFTLKNTSNTKEFNLSEVANVYYGGLTIENVSNFGCSPIWEFKIGDKTHYITSKELMSLIGDDKNFKILTKKGELFLEDDITIESKKVKLPTETELSFMNTLLKSTISNEVIQIFNQRMEAAGIDISDYNISLERDIYDKFAKIVMENSDVKFRFGGNYLDDEIIEISTKHDSTYIDPNIYKYLSFEDIVTKLTSYDYKNFSETDSFPAHITTDLWNLNEDKAIEQNLEHNQDIDTKNSDVYDDREL